MEHCVVMFYIAIWLIILHVVVVHIIKNKDTENQCNFWEIQLTQMASDFQIQ